MENVPSNDASSFDFYIDGKGLNFIENTDDILKELIDSKENGTVIGINAPALGDGMFITGVQDVILEETDTIILLKPYDMSGYILANNKICLSEISSVCPFTSRLKNPYLKEIEKQDKRWFYF